MGVAEGRGPNSRSQNLGACTLPHSPTSLTKMNRSAQVTLKTRLANELEGLAAPPDSWYSASVFLLTTRPATCLLAWRLSAQPLPSVPRHPPHSNLSNFLPQCCLGMSLAGLGGRGRGVVVGTMAGISGTLILPQFCSLGPNSSLTPHVPEHGSSTYTLVAREAGKVSVSSTSGR